MILTFCIAIWISHTADHDFSPRNAMHRMWVAQVSFVKYVGGLDNLRSLKRQVIIAERVFRIASLDIFIVRHNRSYAHFMQRLTFYLENTGSLSVGVYVDGVHTR